jgi:hypothetical protein
MRYAHTQRGGLHWLLWLTAGICLVGAWGAHSEGGALYAVLLLVGVGALTAVLALCFVTLTVRDGGDALEVRFGPIPLFKKRVPYAGIESVQAARSALIDGWGVHWIPGRGWTWNLWGFECVELSVDGDTLRIGTDDAPGLERFLLGRIGATSETATSAAATPEAATPEAATPEAGTD